MSMEEQTGVKSTCCPDEVGVARFTGFGFASPGLNMGRYREGDREVWSPPGLLGRRTTMQGAGCRVQSAGCMMQV